MGQPVNGAHRSVIAFAVPDEFTAAFDEWYSGEHVPMLLEADDWLRVRRYRVPRGAGGPWTHLALHELASVVMDSPERARARNGPLRDAPAGHDWFASPGRWLYERISAVTAEPALGRTLDGGRGHRRRCGPPVGAVLALALARNRLRVTRLESERVVDPAATAAGPQRHRQFLLRSSPPASVASQRRQGQDPGRARSKPARALTMIVKGPSSTPAEAPYSTLIPGRRRPRMPQPAGLQRGKATHHGTKKNRPASRESAASGLFSQCVAGDGFEPSQAEPRGARTAGVVAGC